MIKAKPLTLDFYTCAALFVCVVYVCLTISFFINADVSFPTFDYWGYYSDVARLYPDRIRELLFSPISEHRAVLSFFAMLVDYRYFGLDTTFVKTFHLVSYVLLVIFFVWLWLQTVREFALSVRILVVVSGLFFILSIRQWEIHYGYTNVGTIQAFLFFACSLHLYNRRFDRHLPGGSTRPGLTAVTIFALLSSASMVFGLMTLPFALAVSLLRGAPRKESWFLAALACLFFLVYFMDMPLSPTDKAKVPLHFGDLVRVLHFSTLMLGSLFIVQNKMIAAVIGATGIVLVAAATVAIISKRRDIRSEVVTVYCLLLLSLSYAVMVGIGRRYMADEAAMASRYMLASAIFWQSLFALFLHGGLRYVSRQQRAILMLFRLALIPVMIILFKHQIFRYEATIDMANRNSVGVNALQFGIFDADTFPTYQFSNMNDFWGWAKILKEHGTSIFGDQAVRLYGKKIAEEFTINNNLYTGTIANANRLPLIRQLVDLPSATGMKFSGTVQSKQPGIKHPSRILLVDRHGVIRGSSAFSEIRPIEINLLGLGRDKTIEWTAFARLEQDTDEIQCYALCEKNREACLLGTYRLFNNASATSAGMPHIAPRLAANSKGCQPLFTTLKSMPL